jgi:hypothetical protein
MSLPFTNLMGKHGKSGKRKQRENPASHTLKEKIYLAKQKEILTTEGTQPHF